MFCQFAARVVVFTIDPCAISNDCWRNVRRISGGETPTADSFQASRAVQSWEFVSCMMKYAIVVLVVESIKNCVVFCYCLPCLWPPRHPTSRRRLLGSAPESGG